MTLFLSEIIYIESFLYLRYTTATMNKRLFVFTGGGLSPSLNSTLAAVVASARKRGCRVWGGLRGWASLLPDGQYVELTKEPMTKFKSLGGTFLQTSRTNPIKYPGGRRHVLGQLGDLGIDAVVAIGGDDTLSAAQHLYLEEGIPVYGIPKTIDNDIAGSYVTPGFSTAAERFGEMVWELRERAAHALSRIFIIEAMGLHSGWLTAAAALGGADLMVPPEQPVSFKHFLQVLKKRYHDNGGHAMVAVSQEANFTGGLSGLTDDQADDYAVSRHQFICLSLKQLVKDQLQIDTKAILPGNLLETSNPNKTDQRISRLLGESVVKRIMSRAEPSLATIQYKRGALVVEHRAWHSINLGVTPVLDNSLFDFKSFQPKKKYLNYWSSLGLSRVKSE